MDKVEELVTKFMYHGEFDISLMAPSFEKDFCKFIEKILVIRKEKKETPEGEYERKDYDIDIYDYIVESPLYLREFLNNLKSFGEKPTDYYTYYFSKNKELGEGENMIKNIIRHFIKDSYIVVSTLYNNKMKFKNIKYDFYTERQLEAYEFFTEIFDETNEYIS